MGEKAQDDPRLPSIIFNLKKCYECRKDKYFFSRRKNIENLIFYIMSLNNIVKDNLFDASKSLEIILVYEAMNVGGIETLILRLSNYLIEFGFPVCLYCMPGGDLQVLLNAKVKVVNYKNTEDLINIIKTNKNLEYRGGRVLVLSFDSTPAARALMVELALPRSTEVINITGIFHPTSYFMPGQPLDRMILNYLIAFGINKKNIFFMNQECRTEHARQWRIDLSGCPIIPLPVSLVDSLWKPTKSPSVRIVSVGRLVDFKTYNLGAAQIVRSCLDRGYNVSWDIFGFGPLDEQIKTDIEILGLNQNLRLMGKLKYENFSQKVASYDLFIGMGTSAIEAAMVGIPTICAAVGKVNGSYGYLHDLPFGNVGEIIDGGQLKKIEDMIQSYSEMNLESRKLISERGIVNANLYGMPHFVKSLLDMSSTSKPSSNRMTKYVIGKLYYLLMDGLVAKLFFGRGFKKKLFGFIR